MNGERSTFPKNGSAPRACALKPCGVFWSLGLLVGKMTKGRLHKFDHDTRAIQAYLGHRNIQNTTRYTA
jgi:hypothetical protein